MTGGARGRDVRPGQREARGRVVEARRSPGARAVTYLAGRREAGLDVVGIAGRLEVPSVAGVAVGRGAGVAALVTVGAGDRAVRPLEREAGSRVVEGGGIPAARRVAGRAGRGEARGDVVGIAGRLEVLPVAGVAVGAGSRVAGRVAVRAGERAVRAVEREPGGGVIEGGALPGGRAVAALAGRRIAGGGVVRLARPLVVGPMAGVAVGRGPGVAALVAVGAGDRAVRPLEREAGRGVVEARPLPGGRAVAVLTGRRKAGSDVVRIARRLVVGAMAGVAVRGGSAVAVAVAVGAGRRGVGAGEREARGVGEGGRAPVVGHPDVALLAGDREAAVGRIARLLEVGAVAGDAVGRRQLVLVGWLAAVAGLAVDARVAAVEGEQRLVVGAVEVVPVLPAARVVTVGAGAAELAGVGVGVAVLAGGRHPREDRARVTLGAGRDGVHAEQRIARAGVLERDVPLHRHPARSGVALLAGDRERAVRALLPERGAGADEAEQQGGDRGAGGAAPAARAGLPGARRGRPGRPLLAAETDAAAAQELERRVAADHHEDVVVLDPLGALAAAQDDVPGPDRLDLALEPRVDPSSFDHGLDRLLVLLLDPVEAVLAIGERHPVAGLSRQADRGLDGAVAAAHHQDALAAIGLRVAQLVHHLGQLFAGHAEPARRAPAAQRQDHRARPVEAGRGAHLELLAAALELLEPLAVADVQPVARDLAAEQLEHLLLRVLLAIERAAAGQRDRAGQHHLPAREVEDGAAEAGGLVDDDRREAVPARGERGGDPGGPRPDHEHVGDAGVRGAGARRAQPAGDRLDHRSALLDGVADQREPRQLAGDEDSGQRGLHLVGEQRHVPASLEIAQADLDRADRAGVGAAAVADAPQPVDHHRHAADHAEHVAFRAGAHAGAAADAAHRVDEGELGDRAVDAERARLGEPGAVGVPPLAEGEGVGQHDERGDQRRQRPDHGRVEVESGGHETPPRAVAWRAPGPWQPPQSSGRGL